MILTLTLNPAIDRNVSADKLVFEDRAYILATSESAGGRGINASRVIHCFGGKTIAITTSGGEAGKKFEKLVKRSGFPIEFVSIRNEIRANLTVSDQQGLTVKLNERGPAMSKKELDQVSNAVEKNLKKASWLMLCGSTPPGVDAHFYCRLIEMASARGVKTLLDTDGDALLHGLEAKPTVVAPNQQEAERLLNRALITKRHFQEAAGRIHTMGPERVVLSLGSRGVIAKNTKELLEAIPPRIDAVCPIGAGDALAAAFVWACDHGKTFNEAIRWGVAAGTASTKLPGIQFADLEQTKQVYSQVEVRPVQ